MKTKIITLLIAIVALLGSAKAQTSIQIHKNGEIIRYYNIDDIDSISFANKYFTVNLDNQWRQSSSVNNPDPTQYDGVYESYSNYNINGSTATMSITIYGYNEFTLYVRSNGEKSADYVTVSDLDSPNSVKYSAKGKNNSNTTISSYTEVTFSGIDGGLHTITIKYSKDESTHSGTDRGYILIPKTGTLEPEPDMENGHKYVDLGLPSGLKWATCNVGANTPEASGEHYAWGETEPKTLYNINYKYSGTETTLKLENDVAHVNWGGRWRMPTITEFQELISTSNCTWTWTTQNGVKGYKVISVKNGNSIFLPVTGYRDNGETKEYSYGYYWSSTLYDSFLAYYLRFYSSGISWGYFNRELGLRVRAVCK